MKLRSDSTIAKLTPDQIESLFEWISTVGYFEAIEKAAAPPPNGFGVRFHKTTLVRFFATERDRRNAEALVEEDLSEIKSADPDKLLSQAKRQLAHATFDRAHSPLTDDGFNQLSRAFYRFDLLAQKKRSLEIAERQIDISQARDAERKRQWEFNASRQVMKYFLQLSEIHRTPNQDDEQKIWRARELLFGPASNLQSPITDQQSSISPPSPV